MKWLIASDLHGSALYCEQLLDAYEREKADKLLLLGDLLYHGARNDLTARYDTRAVAAMLNGLRDSIVCVRGNCDSEVDQMVLEFPIMAEYALLTEGGHTIFATHGHRYNSACPPPLGGIDVLLHGHTHVPACVAYPDHLYWNPGSVSLPKDGSHRGYLTLENGAALWKTLGGDTVGSCDLGAGKPIG